MQEMAARTTNEVTPTKRVKRSTEKKASVRKAPTLADAEVVEAIRKGIRTRDLVPGQRLVEADLAEQLNTSRGTVRAALMHLTTEGLVERTVNRSARVRVVGLNEALNILEIRFAIESVILERAAVRITEKKIEELRKIGMTLRDCVERQDGMGYGKGIGRIREIYVQAADQPVARDCLMRLRDQMMGHRFSLTHQRGRPQETLPFWLERIEALAQRDPEAVQDNLRRHVANTRQAMIALADQEEPSPFQ